MTNRLFRMPIALPVATGLAIIALASFAIPTRRIVTQTGKLRVAASFFPIADIARNIAGDAVEVVTILPPGASPHTYEPTPVEAIRLQGVKTVFVIGHGFDAWAESLTNNLPDASIVPVDKGIQLVPVHKVIGESDEPGDGLDPHYWLTAKNGKQIAKNIAEELSRLDPAHADEIAKNLESYSNVLDQTDARVRQILSGKLAAKIVTHHDAWRYFAEAYGLTVAGAFEPSPGRDLSVTELAYLESIIHEKGIKTVFIEPQLSKEVISSLASDLGMSIVTVDPEGSSLGTSYADALIQNAQRIADSL